MDKPIYLSYQPTLDDITDGSQAVNRVARPWLRIMTRILIPVYLVLIFWYYLLSDGFGNKRPVPRGDSNSYMIFLMMMMGIFLLLIQSRPILRFRVARQYKGSPMFKSLIEWWISDAELISASSLSEGHYRWEMVKRMVETRKCFVMNTHLGLHLFIPSRAFHSREDIDRFIALARANSPKYDVIKPIDYAPGIDEKVSFME